VGPFFFLSCFILIFHSSSVKSQKEKLNCAVVYIKIKVSSRVIIFLFGLVFIKKNKLKFKKLKIKTGLIG